LTAAKNLRFRKEFGVNFKTYDGCVFHIGFLRFFSGTKNRVLYILKNSKKAFLSDILCRFLSLFPAVYPAV
jgi:hypothetical protein